MITSMVTWHNHIDGGVDLTFRNCVTGAEETRHYKSHRAAACAETKFHNRMSRIAASIRDSEIPVHTPLDG